MAQMPLLVSACWTSGVKEIAVHAGNPLHLTPKNKIMLIASNCLPGAGKGTLIAGSQHIADTIPGDFWLRTRALQLCYNGIDLRKFPFTPKSRASKPPIVGMVARLDPIKDQRTLLRSWKQVRNKFPRATLELAGRGPLLAELEALARSLAIDRSVRFLGNVSDIAALIRGWDVVVHSTTANEGLGLAMVETMAVGRPLVATDIGPVREIVTSNTAELVAPKDPEAMADAILRTLPYGPETQERISLARQEVEKRFSSHIMIRGYLTALGLATDQPLPYKQDAELQSIANTLP
jgi:glycosyltransferase involved in cell wall biosynthesis